MTISIAQEATNAGTGSSGTIAVTLTVTAGNALHVFATTDSGSSANFTGISDTLSNSYSAVLDNVNDVTNAQRLAHWVASNISGGSCTVTVSISPNSVFRGIWVREIQGCTSSPLDGHTGQAQSAPGTGTDGITTGNFTSANGPNLISALTVNTTTAGTTFTAGTGYGGATGGMKWPIYSATNQGLAESQRFATAGTRAATFTDSGNQPVITVGAAFDEAAGAVGTTINPMWIGQMAVQMAQ